MIDARCVTFEEGWLLDGRRREWLWRGVADEVAHRGASWHDAVCAVGHRTLAAGTAITLRTDTANQELVAASQPWAALLESTQCTVGEGPGVEAFTTGSPVLVGDLVEQEHRWPLFMDTARTQETLAVFAFPMQSGGIRLGTLDFYRRVPGFLSQAELADATILSDLATRVVLTRTGSSDDLLSGKESGRYQDVHVATGMLAVLLRCGLEDAFAQLRARAFSEGRPLLELSQDVVARRIDPTHWTD